MIITEQKQIRYVPETHDNKKLEEKKRVVVTLQLPTAVERSQFRSITYKSGADKGAASTGYSLERDAKRIIEACVLSIENLQVKQANGTVCDIRTGAQLLALRNVFASELVDELTTLLLLADEIPEEAEKK